MKISITILLIIISYLASGQSDFTKGLINIEIRDSVFKELIIKNEYYKQSGPNKEKYENERSKVDTVIICLQDNGDTIYTVFEKNKSKVKLEYSKKNGHILLFDKLGKNIKYFQSANYLKGEIINLNQNNTTECIDNIQILTGYGSNGITLNYLYVLPITNNLASNFGILYNENWFWTISDINNDSIYEIQIGPKLNDKNSTSYYYKVIEIEPKVTFYWSKTTNTYYTNDDKYIDFYSVLDFSIPYPKDKKVNKRYSKVLEKYENKRKRLPNKR